MLSEPSKIRREAATRRKKDQYVSVSNAEVPRHLNAGWEVAKPLKLRTRIRKPWSHDEQLENRMWLLLFLLGYPELSGGRQFQVTIKRPNAAPYRKQIDVLAKDDETVIVAECKSSEKTATRRSLQKDLEEFASLKGPISRAVKSHYGNQFKPKIVWLFVTNNIVWSHPDTQRAIGSNINVVTERELTYYLQIADHLRSAARFQFLAEFLNDQTIPEMANVRVPAVRGKIGGKTFYSFVSTPLQMLKISFVNHRSLNDPAGAPSYQRLMTRTRLRQISRFIQQGGYFPTNILVNFTKKPRFDRIDNDPETNVTFGHLYLPSKYKSAWVIDGQHRLYGFAPLTDKHLRQSLMVVAFDRLSKQEEADLFVSINHEQKSVPKTLLDDLEGDLKWGSEKPAERIGAVSARLIGLLSSDVGEPLYGRVARQGIRPTGKACLTIPALKDGLRRSGLIGQAILKGREYAPGPLAASDDLGTLDRARPAINRFLRLIADANPDHWEAGSRGFLCTNVGLQAYFRLFGALVAYLQKDLTKAPRELLPDELVSQVEPFLRPVTDSLHTLSTKLQGQLQSVPYGSRGPREYFFILAQLIQEKFPDFHPDGMDAWRLEQSADSIAEADRKLRDLNVLVQRTIFDIFREEYGSENEAYWHKGVTDKAIRTKAYHKSLDDDDDRLPPENYLDFIEYKKIVEHKSHWNLFKPQFDIPEKDAKGVAKNVGWMERINELRRIPAHATEQRRYKAEDIEYIDWVFYEFTYRLEAAGRDTTVRLSISSVASEG